MDSLRLKTLSAPPSLMKSIMAGFDVIANHLSLVLFSVGLDLLLWFSPRLRLLTLFEPLFKQAEALPEMQKAGTVEVLRQGAEQMNMLGVLRTFPIGVPSLMASRFSMTTPISSPLLVDISLFTSAVGIWLLLILFGVGLGTLYFSLVAQAAIAGRLNIRQAFIAWPRNFSHVLLLAVFWYILIATFLLPLSCMLSLLLYAGIGFGQFPLLIALLFGGVLVWLMIPLFFSPHGIFVYQKPMWVSILQGIRISRATFSTTGLLILVVVVLSEGLNILWNTPAENSWFLLVGITAHAFVAASLLAATFVYYRDADLWVKELVRLRELSRA